MVAAAAQLNPQQVLAATHGHIREPGTVRSGPLLIIAGAGTGKTMTLAHRVAHLLNHGVSPERILLLTFSRRAAQEMTRRAIAIAASQGRPSPVGSAPIKLPWSGTFHAIGQRLLRSFGPRIGLDPGFSIIDQTDGADLMDVLRHERGFSRSRKRFPGKSVCLSIYSRCINGERGLEAVLTRDFPWCADWESELRILFEDYVDAKQRQALLDFDDLLLHWLWLVEQDAVATAISGQFDHILVDEYQDTNRLQAEIISALRPDGEGLCVVGDDAQSIYAFRCAEVANILEFPNRFDPPAAVIPLERNYRSTQPLLDLSNTLLSESPVAYRKRLHSDRGSGERARLVTVESDLSQAAFVVKSVLARREQGTRLRDQAVLFRSGHHSDRLEVELVRRDIPYVKYGGLKYLESAHVKDVLSVLRWADNPRNRISGFRVLKLLPGVGPVHAGRALDFLEGRNFRFTAFSEQAPPNVDSSLWQGLSALLAGLQDGEAGWRDQMEQLLNWYGPVLELNHDDHFVRMADLEQLAQISQQYASRQQFLAELTLDPPSASGDLAGVPHLDDDFLILSTVHSAKGQEWKHVYVLNVADGNFPNEFACGDERGVEEERRLLYVAMTRARQTLDLIQPLKYWVPEQPKYGDRHVYGARSRFLTSAVMKHLDCHFYADSEAQGSPGETSSPQLDRLPDLARRAKSRF